MINAWIGLAATVVGAVIGFFGSIGGQFFQRRFEKQKSQYEEKKAAYLGALKILRVLDVKGISNQRAESLLEESISILNEVNLFGSREVSDLLEQAFRAAASKDWKTNYKGMERKDAIKDLSQVIQKELDSLR